MKAKATIAAACAALLLAACASIAPQDAAMDMGHSPPPAAAR